MKIVEFINAFNETEYKDKLIQKHITKPYMNWLIKVAEAESIVQKSCYNEDGKFRLNSPLRYYLYIITIIKNYTDLEFTENETMYEFDILEKNGINDYIIQEIGEDVGRFNTVLKMTLDDHMENYRSLPSYFDSKKDALMMILDSIQLSEDADVTMEANQDGEWEQDI